MLKKVSIIVLIFLISLVYLNAKVTEIDLLEKAGLDVNGIGPVIVKCDAANNRVIAANTLSSSVSIIDGETNEVTNIPVPARALQHLKAASMTVNEENGSIYLVATKCFMIIPTDGKVKKIDTEIQLESIAVDENSGNVFVCGREINKMYIYDASQGKLKKIDWLEHKEKLINLNQTPPPPIRRVIAANELGQIIALDGFESKIYMFDGETGKILSSRDIELSSGGRWHVAGYNHNTHKLFLATENSKRRIDQAAVIDVTGNDDLVVKMPEGYSEPVGICYNIKLNETYITYDNNPSVHVIDFNENGKIDEIAVPAFGNDATAIDVKNDILYIASWAKGEVEIVDLRERKFLRRITDLGIIPHMFAMCFNPNNNKLYYPLGATAVNGCFGAAVTMLDPETEETEKIYTGWAPIDLIEVKKRNSFILFNNEDHFAEVKYDGSVEFYPLPFDFPIRTIYDPEGDIYLSYGAHQSYWPTVYIWGAKNGILKIDKESFQFYDRRIPAQSMDMELGKNGKLYMAMNNWGRREQFIGVLKDEVRKFEIGDRIKTGDTIQRETTQRLLEYDSAAHNLYLARAAEEDSDPSILQEIDLDSNKMTARYEIGLNVTDLLITENNIYTANFDSDNIIYFDKNTYDKSEIKTGDGPLKLEPLNGRVYVLNHHGNSIQEVSKDTKPVEIPYLGKPNNFFAWKDKLIITSHGKENMHIIAYHPKSGQFELLHEVNYPYGETSFDTYNSSFYMSGQFGDAVFSITRAKIDQNGKLWISEFLSGKLYILE